MALLLQWLDLENNVDISYILAADTTTRVVSTSVFAMLELSLSSGSYSQYVMCALSLLSFRYPQCPLVSCVMLLQRYRC